jgi:hypothetical protein
MIYFGHHEEGSLFSAAVAPHILHILSYTTARPRCTMSSSYRSPQKGYSKGYRSSPYGTSPRQSNGGAPGPTTFQPNAEILEDEGPNISPDIELARRDTLYHYLIRSRFFRGKSLAVVCVEKPDYIQWMKTNITMPCQRNTSCERPPISGPTCKMMKKTSGPCRRFAKRHRGSEMITDTFTCKSASSQRRGTRHPMH